MAVDLSRVGLEGIETGQRTLTAIANRESQALKDQIELGEYQQTQADLELDRIAVGNAKRIMAGEGREIGTENTTEDDMARFLALTGGQLASAGAPKRGKEMMEASLDLIKKRGDINKQEHEQAKTQLDNTIKASQHMYEVLSDSMNENEYQYNLANLPPEIVSILGEDNVAAMRELDWSPELVDFFKVKALSVKDQAQLELSARGHKRAEEAAADAKLARQAALDIRRDNLRIAEEREKRLSKAGGSNVSAAPTPNERKTAEAAIGRLIESDAQLDDASLFHLTEDIVGEAKQLLADSPGLTFPEAINRSVMAAKARGDFTPITSYRAFGPFRTKGKVTGKTYTPRGQEQDNPLPLPADKSKLVKGRYYEKNGKVGQYGTDFN